MPTKKLDAVHSTKKIISYDFPQSSIAEHYRVLRTNINFLSSHEKPLRSIVITSASASEGRSTTAANLAIVSAQEGKKVLLIDADMRNPTMHSTFFNESSAGLSELLIKKMELRTVIQSTLVKNLDLLPSGSIPPNPLELLSSEFTAQLFDHLYGMYDLIIVDAPPILSVADSKIIANRCDGVIMVVKSGSTEKSYAVKAKEEILLSNCRLIGIVLNDCKTSYS